MVASLLAKGPVARRDHRLSAQPHIHGGFAARRPFTGVLRGERTDLSWNRGIFASLAERHVILMAAQRGIATDWTRCPTRRQGVLVFVSRTTVLPARGWLAGNAAAALTCFVPPWVSREATWARRSEAGSGAQTPVRRPETGTSSSPRGRNRRTRHASRNPTRKW
jgi:hypothetical protein